MIVDSHIHLYDPTRPQGIPWPRPEDQIYRTVLPGNFCDVALPQRVTHAIVVEASPWLEDNQWILDIMHDEETMLGFVGNLGLSSPDFPGWLERFSANPLFRGIRARGVENETLLKEPQATHLELLASKGLSLDMLAPFDGLELVASVAQRIPDLRIIVDHLGHPAADGAEPSEIWRQGIRRSAESPNVFCKVSRITEAAVKWPAPTDPVFYRPILEHLWQSFGPARLLWGSNWPVAEGAGDYGTTLSVVEAFLADADPADREAVLCLTSKEAYGWRERE